MCRDVPLRAVACCCTSRAALPASHAVSRLRCSMLRCGAVRCDARAARALRCAVLQSVLRCSMLRRFAVHMPSASCGYVPQCTALGCRVPRCAATLDLYSSPSRCGVPRRSVVPCAPHCLLLMQSAACVVTCCYAVQYAATHELPVPYAAPFDS